MDQTRTLRSQTATADNRHHTLTASAHTATRAGSSKPPLAGRIVLGLLARLERGTLQVTTPQGDVLLFAGGQPGPSAELRLLDWSVCTDLLRSGDIGFAQAYMEGRWDTADLAALLELAALNHARLERASFGRRWGTLVHRLRHWLRPNTRRGSLRNIRLHYDLGNEFYALWLDETMSYSAALFGGRLELTLAQAQRAKYRQIADTLQLAPGMRVLEVGCGWGEFARYAAQERGCDVTAITVSARQHAAASARLAAHGLGKRARVRMVDYRDVYGSYDRVVSIEMFEAVGERYWPRYFAMLRDRLAPSGRALVQTITIDDAVFARYRRGTDFIQQYIFPGGMLPSPRRFEAEARRAGFDVRSALRFGADYAETLARWLRAFDEHAEHVRAQGFDEAFLRRWRFYLAYARAGFVSGNTDVIQFELAPARSR